MKETLMVPKKSCKKCFGRGIVGTLVNTDPPVPVPCVCLRKTEVETPDPVPAEPKKE